MKGGLYMIEKIYNYSTSDEKAVEKIIMDDLYVNKVLNGDVEAFRYFVDTYKNYAFSLSFSITKNTYYSEEAIQEAKDKHVVEHFTILW